MVGGLSLMVSVSVSLYVCVNVLMTLRLVSWTHGGWAQPDGICVCVPVCLC
jgi:hypothetical protein